MKNVILSVCIVLLMATASAAPPYGLVLTWQNAATGLQPDGYNFYINDCAATGATAAPAATIGNGGAETLNGILTADGVYLVCIRSLTNKPNPATDQCPGDIAPDPTVLACENPDPGNATDTVDVSDFVLAQPAESLDVQVLCPNSGCVVIITP